MEQSVTIPKDAVTARPGLDGRIRRYWTRRSDAFGQVRREELQSDKSSLWRAEILPWLPYRENGAPLRILDLGTGAGFFAILLAQAGCEVTGIDLSEGMLAQAAALADEAGCTVDWRCMSATELDFEESSFDGVLARNLTWTLTDPEAAYAEWLRVLRPAACCSTSMPTMGRWISPGLPTRKGSMPMPMWTVPCCRKARTSAGPCP